MSATKLQRKPTQPYQQSIDEVLAALNTGPRVWLELSRSAGAARKIWQERVNGGKAGARMEKVSRAVPDVLVILSRFGLLPTVRSAMLISFIERPPRFCKFS